MTHPVLYAKRTQLTTGIFSTAFYNDLDELLLEIPADQRQPSRTTKTLEVDGIRYRVNWDQVNVKPKYKYGPPSATNDWL